VNIETNTMKPIDPTSETSLSNHYQRLRDKLKKSKKKMINKARVASIDIVDLSPEAQDLLKDDK